jgi:hypothetical protein
MVVKNCKNRLYQDDTSPHKFMRPNERYHNPTPGTMVFENLPTNKDGLGFHLVAQSVTKGTATVTQYRIAFDKSDIPIEAAAQLALEQSFNYPNWMGGIKVPAVLHGATRLAKLVGVHIHQDIPAARKFNLEEEIIKKKK